MTGLRPQFDLLTTYVLHVAPVWGICRTARLADPSQRCMAGVSTVQPTVLSVRCISELIQYISISSDTRASDRAHADEGCQHPDVRAPADLENQLPLHPLYCHCCA